MDFTRHPITGKKLWLPMSIQDSAEIEDAQILYDEMQAILEATAEHREKYKDFIGPLRWFEQLF